MHGAAFGNALLGDANGDGVVDGGDFTLWADNYEQPGGWGDGDFSGDGFVDGADFTLWADNYGYGSVEQAGDLAVEARSVKTRNLAVKPARAAVFAGSATRTHHLPPGPGEAYGDTLLVRMPAGMGLPVPGNEPGTPAARRCQATSHAKKASGLGRTRLLAVEEYLDLLDWPDWIVLAPVI